MDELQDALTALITVRGHLAEVEGFDFRQTLRDGRKVYVENRTSVIGEAYGPRLGKTILSFCIAWFDIFAKGSNTEITDDVTVGEVMGTLDAVLRVALPEMCFHFVQHQGVTKWVETICTLTREGSPGVVNAMEVFHLALPFLISKIDTFTRGKEKEILQRQIDDAISLLRETMFQDLPGAANLFPIATVSHIVAELLEIQSFSIGEVKIFRMGLIFKLDICSRCLHTPEAFDWMIALWNDITMNEYSGELNSPAFAEAFLTTFFANVHTAQISVLRRVHELLIVVFRATPRSEEKVPLMHLAPPIRAALQEGLCHTVAALPLDDADALFEMLSPDPSYNMVVQQGDRDKESHSIYDAGIYDRCSLQFLLDLTRAMRKKISSLPFTHSWGFHKILELFMLAPEKASKDGLRWYLQHVAPLFPRHLPAAIRYCLTYDSEFALDLTHICIACSNDMKGLLDVIQSPLATIEIVTAIMPHFPVAPPLSVLDSIWDTFFVEQEEKVAELFRAFYVSPQASVRQYARAKDTSTWTKGQVNAFAAIFDADVMQSSTFTESFFFPSLPRLDSSDASESTGNNYGFFKKLAMKKKKNAAAYDSWKHDLRNLKSPKNAGLCNGTGADMSDEHLPSHLILDSIGLGEEDEKTLVKEYTNLDELKSEASCLLAWSTGSTLPGVVPGVATLLGLSPEPPRALFARGGPTLLEFYPLLEHGARMAICHDILLTLHALHMKNCAHQSLSLSTIRIDARRRPILHDFENAYMGCKTGSTLNTTKRPLVIPSEWRPPEILDGDTDIIPQALDMYAFGLIVGKLNHQNFAVQGLPYHPITRLLPLPDELSLELRHLLQELLRRSPHHRGTATTGSLLLSHPSFSYSSARGSSSAPRWARSCEENESTERSFTSPAAFFASMDVIRRRYAAVKVEETLVLSRLEVFTQLSSSSIRTWPIEWVLSDWRVLLEDEAGVDIGGIGREIIGLFFDQLRESDMVVQKKGHRQENGNEQRRQENDDNSYFYITPYSLQTTFQTSFSEWRAAWHVIGILCLRSLVHLHTMPLELSPLLLHSLVERLELPPDTKLSLDEIRQRRGDAWATLCVHRLLEAMEDPAIKQSYLWLLAEAVHEPDNVLEQMEDLVEEQVYAWARARNEELMSDRHGGGHGGECSDVTRRADYVEWALLWDIYLKYVGTDGRPSALEAFAQGLSLNGKVKEVFHVHGNWDKLQSPALTPALVLDNIEFKPEYGYEDQKQFFQQAIERMSEERLSMFLRFAVGMTLLPPSGKFPNKLTVRLVPGMDDDRLPAAHTCFFTFDLPVYHSLEQLESKLHQAIFAGSLPFALS